MLDLKRQPIGLFSLIALVFLGCGFTQAGAAELTLTSRDLDTWARFPQGSWKLVRTITQSYDVHGQPTQKTTVETQTTLAKVDERSMCLKIDVTTQVNGRRIEGIPQQIEQGFWGEPTNQPATERIAGQNKLLIEGQEIPCTIHEASYSDGKHHTLTKQYVSPDQAPFVLKRESVTTVGENLNPRYRTVSEVYALQMPCKIGNEVKLASHERIIRQTPEETLISLDVTVPDIPGGVVSRTTKELDSTGKLIRHSTMELISFHIADDNDPPREQRRRRLFHRDQAKK
jgi:hypothetical protein